MLGWPFLTARFRLLRQHDRRLLLDHLNRLSDADLYHRFLTHMDGEQLRAHVALRYPDHETIGWFRRGVLRGAAEIFYHDDRAEAGLTLEPGWRGQGIGTQLVRHALARARKRRMHSLEILAHRGNLSMICIAAKFDALESLAHGHLIEGLAPDAPLPAWFIFDLYEPPAEPRRQGLLGHIPGNLGALLGRYAS